MDFQKKHIPQKPLILAVETSAPMGSVAIATGEQMLAEAHFSSPMRHSAEIFPAIDRLLEQLSRRPEDIEHIYISIGPGSFTGLRIATALAKTMHLANAAKIVAVDTSDVIAANTVDCTDEKDLKFDKIATILDAKRGQFFVAVYKHPHESKQQTRNTRYEIRDTSSYPLSVVRYPLLKILPDCLMTAEQFLDKFAGTDKPIWLLGEGLVYYKDKFKADGIEFLDKRYWTPQAAKVHLLGWKKALVSQFADHLTLQPVYLRKPDVKLKQ